MLDEDGDDDDGRIGSGMPSQEEYQKNYSSRILGFCVYRDIKAPHFRDRPDIHPLRCSLGCCWWWSSPSPSAHWVWWDESVIIISPTRCFLSLLLFIVGTCPAAPLKQNLLPSFSSYHHHHHQHHDASGDRRRWWWRLYLFLWRCAAIKYYLNDLYFDVFFTWDSSFSSSCSS